MLSLTFYLTSYPCKSHVRRDGRPGSSEVPRNPLTRWDVSSIPANGIFLTKKLKTKMPNGWRTIKSVVHKIRLHGRRGKGMAESLSREKLRHAPQKEVGWEINPVWPSSCVTPAGTSNELDVQNEWEENTHKHGDLPRKHTHVPLPDTLPDLLLMLSQMKHVNYKHHKR